MSYGRKTVLSDLSLTIEPGRIVGLLGPNGTGKTTLMRILAGFTSNYKGTVLINGSRPGLETKSQVAYLPDRNYLAPWVQAVDAIRYFRDFFPDFDEKRANEMLRQFHIDEKTSIRDMSKGMQDKLQIALTLSRDAKIYLLDEPLASVDPVTRNAILDATLRQYREDAVMLFATHMINEVERVFDRVIFLGEGKIKLYDDVELIREKYGKSVEELFEEVFACSENY
jgi:ABC-2 type transport system ATP-binding protein